MTAIMAPASEPPHSDRVDPLAGSAWSAPGTVAGFSKSAPNRVLMAYAERQRHRARTRVLDIGCGAGRNAVPLAQSGMPVIGTDLSWPMLGTASERGAGLDPRLVLAPMDALPVRSGTVDLIVAHGIWNLARTGLEFRQAVAEAARVGTAGAALFVFTFSRRTLPPAATPVADESFVFTQFSGSPQVFLTEDQLIEELGTAGFVPDPALPLRELNVPAPGIVRSAGTPVIYEAGFRLS
jgi:SAM-dependent methyltransferase